MNVAEGARAIGGQRATRSATSAAGASTSRLATRPSNATSFASFQEQLARYRLGGSARTAVRPTDDQAIVAASLGQTQVAGTFASRVGSATDLSPVVSAVEPTRSASAVAPVPGSRPMAISSFPRPKDDNGRGMHWVPITHTTAANVDRYVDEAEKMGVKWMVILNDDAKIGESDYLVNKLVDRGIMPIMRLYTHQGEPIKGDVEAMVRHYKSLGVEYYQLYNEPNLCVENPDGVPNVERYTDLWLRDAKRVVTAGGLPGFGALAPGGNFDDIEFLKQSFDRVKAKGETATLDRAWLSLHNYTLNHPLDYTKDSNGFLKYKFYDQIVREKLGRQMPIIGTEGGTFVGANEDTTMAPITEQKQVEMVVGAYDIVKEGRDPYMFAYSYWVIANEAGGGHDLGFSRHALFRPDGSAGPVVEALRRTARDG